jgi:hypothetical protein
MLGLLSMGFHVGYGQSTASVSGVVRDGSNNPISGATVSIENLSTKYKQMNTTNAAGTFSFDRIPEGQGYEIKISFVGFKTKVLSNYNIDSKDKVAITVALEQEQESLEEVVVVGYGKQKKANITGSVASVNAEQLKNISPSNLSNALAGRAPRPWPRAAAARPRSRAAPPPASAARRWA